MLLQHRIHRFPPSDLVSLPTQASHHRPRGVQQHPLHHDPLPDPVFHYGGGSAVFVGFEPEAARQALHFLVQLGGVGDRNVQERGHSPEGHAPVRGVEPAGREEDLGCPRDRRERFVPKSIIPPLNLLRGRDRHLLSQRRDCK